MSAVFSPRRRAVESAWSAGSEARSFSEGFVPSGSTPGCSAGVSAGCSAGVSVGCSAGVSEGCSAGVSVGCSAGVSAGCSAGDSAGCSAGVSAGCSAGVSAGCSAGVSAGCSAGVSAGCSHGSCSPPCSCCSAAGCPPSSVAYAAIIDSGCDTAIMNTRSITSTRVILRFADDLLHLPLDVLYLFIMILFSKRSQRYPLPCLSVTPSSLPFCR